MTRRKYSRRTVLGKALAAGAGLACAPVLRAVAADVVQLEGPLGLIQLDGWNLLARSTRKGLVLVDSGPAATSAALLGHVDALAGGDELTLFNTHWHAEVTGGNAALGAKGATIIAHEKTRLRLGTEYYLPHEERYQQALPPDALPTQTIYTEGTLAVDGETIDYGYLRQAHTDGDIFTFFRDANVLAVGDVASPEHDPVLDWYGGGWIGGRVDALDQLLALADDATRIVPAYGAVMNKTGLQAERDMMQFLYDQLVDQIRLGMSAQDSLETGLMEQLPRTFQDPYAFLYAAHKGLWAHHNKLAPNIV